MFKNVTIRDNDHYDTDEIYTDFFTCPKCECNDIQKGFNYCPGCGSKLMFDLKGRYEEYGSDFNKDLPHTLSQWIEHFSKESLFEIDKNTQQIEEDINLYTFKEFLSLLK